MEGRKGVRERDGGEERDGEEGGGGGGTGSSSLEILEPQGD